MRIKPLLAGAGALALATTLVGAPAQAHDRPAPPRAHELADGLVTPLSLDLGRHGDVYVTQNMAGLLSKVDRRGHVSTVHRAARGTEVAGVAYDRGYTYHVETVRSETPGKSTSHIIRTSWDGKRTVVSQDLWRYEERNNPDKGQAYGFANLDRTCRAKVAAYQKAAGAPPIINRYRGMVDSHAYQLEVRNGTIYVADAGANAILKVNERTKRISTVAVLPGMPVRFDRELKSFLEGAFDHPGFPSCTLGKTWISEPVPTDVVQGRNRELFVSTLGGGAGEVKPLGAVYRIKGRLGADRVTPVTTGLSGATGLDRDRNGDLYVAEMFGGEISRISAHDIRHAHRGHTARAWAVVKAETPADVKVSGHHLYATIKATAETGGSLGEYDLKKRRRGQRRGRDSWPDRKSGGGGKR